MIDYITDKINRLLKLKEQYKKLNEVKERYSQKEFNDFEDKNTIQNIEEEVNRLYNEMQIIYDEVINSIQNNSSDFIREKDDFNNKLPNFVNKACIQNENIKRPFLVAILYLDPEMIYQEIIDNYPLDDDLKDLVRGYIYSQKQRINNNLLLSDRSLVDLLESVSGNNVLYQEKPNEVLEHKCNKLSYDVFRTSIYTMLRQRSVEDIVKCFASVSMFSSNDITMIKNELFRIKQRLSIDSQSLVLSSDFETYDLRPGVKLQSLTGKKIKRFDNDKGRQFVRTMDDMILEDYPVEDVEDLIFENFSSNTVSKDVKEQMIRAVIENLELCRELFYSYYKDGNFDVTTYLHMTNGTTIETHNIMEERNLPHILGIPKSHGSDMSGNIKANLPNETFNVLHLNPNQRCSAQIILDKIIENKDSIIEDLGCFKGADGNLYEMLPWEKIILKTNAFIRGDFFKTTSLIAKKNPNSYLISPQEKINAISISSTRFGESAINQNDVEINIDKINRNRDLIIKGLEVEIEKVKTRSGKIDDAITRINAVITNESFIGERLHKYNGDTIHTMNKPIYLLKNETSSGDGVGNVIATVENRSHPGGGGLKYFSSGENSSGGGSGLSGAIATTENELGRRDFSLNEIIMLINNIGGSLGREPFIINDILLNILNDAIENEKDRIYNDEYGKDFNKNKDNDDGFSKTL